MRVCDECGMPAGMCHHAEEPGYMLMDRADFEWQEKMLRRGMWALVAVMLACLLALHACVERPTHAAPVVVAVSAV